ncbi:MAG: serine kinase [Bacteroidales bacterium]|nr:serine kinase [Bacteroidales bacterium]
MKVKDLVGELNLEVVAGDNLLENEISGGFCSDLLSYVMGKAAEGQVWITIQGHGNIIAVAALKEVAAIIVADNMVVEPTAIELANEEGVVVLKASQKTFELAGLINNLLAG